MSIPDVGVEVDFCDDWSTEYKTNQALIAVPYMGASFECCSGRSLNRLKSKILPTQTLSQLETAGALQRRAGRPIVSNAKILGLWLGHQFRASKIGQEKEAKYYSRMFLLRASGFVAKTIVLNVFLRSPRSYIGRHSSIPIAVRRRIQEADLGFLCRVP